MAGAAGGFVTRAFESMLKECAAKKYSSLQSAIQSYIDSNKEGNNQTQLDAAVAAVEQKSEHNSDEGVNKENVKSDESHGHGSVETEQAGRPARMNVSIVTALSNAGHTLDGAEAELVLKPLRLAFETKNIKVIELALDCLHKLIAYDHLEGDPGLDGGKNAPLCADILSMYCFASIEGASDSCSINKI